MIKNILFILTIIPMTHILSGAGLDSFCLLRLSVTEKEITAKNVRFVPEKLKTLKSFQPRADHIIFKIVDKNGNVLYMNQVYDPRIIYTEDMHHFSNPDKKQVVTQLGLIEIKFPQFESIDRIELYSHNTKSNELIFLNSLNWEEISID